VAFLHCLKHQQAKPATNPTRSLSSNLSSNLLQQYFSSSLPLPTRIFELAAMPSQLKQHKTHTKHSKNALEHRFPAAPSQPADWNG
jgi:hypothetical protein